MTKLLWQQNRLLKKKTSTQSLDLLCSHQVPVCPDKQWHLKPAAPRFSPVAFNTLFPTLVQVPPCWQGLDAQGVPEWKFKNNCFGIGKSSLHLFASLDNWTSSTGHAIILWKSSKERKQKNLQRGTACTGSLTPADMPLNICKSF